MAFVVFTSGLAFAQLGNGLAAVGLVDPANGFPKWYLDHNGLQLGQCLDTSAVDPCGLILAGALPNPALPVSFPGNFPGGIFYWRAVGRVFGIGTTGARGEVVLSVQGGFGGPTLTPADGIAAAGVFARFRIVIPNGLTPGATYSVTHPFGAQSFVADALGAFKFTRDIGCIPVAGAVPPPCNFASVLPETNSGPLLQWDPAASIPPAGFIGQPAIPHAVIGSPVNTNIVRFSGPNIGGPGINSLETNLFLVTGKIYVRPATTTTMTSAPNPSAVGQAVTLSATVAKVAPATEALTGTVTFFDGATALGAPVPLTAAGTASLTVTTLTAGTHSLTATYNGNLDFAVSTSAAVTQTVKNRTTTSLTSAPNPSNLGQAVTLNASVTSPGGVPTGSVTFMDGATTLGTAALVNGSASISVSTLTAGSHPLTAIYAETATFFGSTSAVVTQVVNIPTTTSLASAPNPSVTGQAVTLSATVTSAGGIPTGTVTFRDGATVLGTVTLVNGSASLSISTLAVGAHSLTAAYSGAGNFLASTSAAVAQTVNPGSTTTTLTSTPNPSGFGQAVTLSATVSAVAPAVGVPAGTVTFRDGVTVLGTATLVNGRASLSISTLAVGSHPLTAAYGGSATFAASTSAAVNQVVNAGNSTTSLTATPNPSITGQAVTLTATVSAVAPATGVPTGTVTFRDGVTVLGTATLVNGSASISTSTLAVGSHPLTAAYGGSATFAASTSATVTQVVNAPGVAATTTSLTSTPNPSTTGQAVTLTATVTSAAGVPTGTVTFRDGATVLGTATLVNGSASISISTLAVGTHPLTAAYGGSAAFAASTSATVNQVVNNPAAGTDTVSINRAEFVVAQNRLRVEGTTTAVNGVFAATVEIHNGPAVGGACTGALITTINNPGGVFRLDGTATPPVTSVCVKSAGGGVATSPVAQK